MTGGQILSVDSINVTFPVDLKTPIDTECSTMVIKSGKREMEWYGGSVKRPGKRAVAVYWISGIQ